MNGYVVIYDSYIEELDKNKNFFESYNTINN